MKTGTPTTAAMMPTWTSAGGSTTRPTVSATHHEHGAGRASRAAARARSRGRRARGRRGARPGRRRRSVRPARSRCRPAGRWRARSPAGRAVVRRPRPRARSSPRARVLSRRAPASASSAPTDQERQAGEQHVEAAAADGADLPEAEGLHGLAVGEQQPGGPARQPGAQRGTGDGELHRGRAVAAERGDRVDEQRRRRPRRRRRSAGTGSSRRGRTTVIPTTIAKVAPALTPRMPGIGERVAGQALHERAGEAEGRADGEAEERCARSAPRRSACNGWAASQIAVERHRAGADEQGQQAGTGQRRDRDRGAGRQGGTTPGLPAEAGRRRPRVGARTVISGALEGLDDVRAGSR